jgi:hypothetical protein
MPAVVLCCRAKAQSPLVQFDSVAEARTFAAQLPCGGPCEHDHLLCWLASGVIAW